MQASIVAVCISTNKGERKKPVASVTLQEEHGIVGDAHAGPWHRQVSLLATESIAKMRSLGLDVDSGDFAENITTAGVDLVALPIGTCLTIGTARPATASCPRKGSSPRFWKGGRSFLAIL